MAANIVEFKKSDGDSIYINVNHVVFFRSNGYYTFVTMIEKTVFTLSDKPEYVYRVLTTGK